MLTVFLGVDGVCNVAAARSADTARYARFFHGMLAAGIYLPPSQFEAMFVSLAHSREDVDHLGRAARAALAQG
jgi:glutamate-1-semialdehyde 2,1-aminomutase